MLPSYCPVNAIQFPSGENFGRPSCPPVVSWRASPPSRGTLQRYPPYANTIWVLLIVGACTSSGFSSAAADPPGVHNIANNTANRGAAILAEIRKRIVPPEVHRMNFFPLREPQRARYF